MFEDILGTNTTQTRSLDDLRKELQDYVEGFQHVVFNQALLHTIAEGIKKRMIEEFGKNWNDDYEALLHRRNRPGGYDLEVEIVERKLVQRRQ